MTKRMHAVGGFALLLLSGAVLADPDTMFTVKVVEEDGVTPVQGALVHGGFVTGSGSWMGQRESYGEDITTGADGLASFEHSSIGQWGFTVQKKGYYDCRTDKLKRAQGVDKSLFSDHWLPWNYTYVIPLRKIGNPVAMYAGSVVKGLTGAIDVPVKDKPIGFDLIERDWVIPYGLGTHSDFVFSVHQEGKYQGVFNTTVKLTFSNRGDGIIPVDIPAPSDAISVFRWPRYAPTDGYQAFVEKYMRGGPPEPKGRRLARAGQILKSRVETNSAQTSQVPGGYFFRIRSVVDAQGQVREAMYGKIPGDFMIGWTGGFDFVYYLNPDKTRNLEFDTSKPLFDPHISTLEP